MLLFDVCMLNLLYMTTLQPRSCKLFSLLFQQFPTYPLYVISVAIASSAAYGHEMERTLVDNSLALQSLPPTNLSKSDACVGFGWPWRQLRET